MREELLGAQEDLEFLSGISGGGTPAPDKARFAAFIPAPAASPSGFQLLTLVDTKNITGGGSSFIGKPATIGSGAAMEIDAQSITAGGSPEMIFGAPFIWPGRKTSTRFTIAYDVADNTTAVDVYMGIGVDVTGGAPAPTDGIFMGFNKAAGVAEGNWKLIGVVGSVFTIVDTGVPIVRGKRYKCEITVGGGSVPAVSLTINGQPSPPLVSGFPTAVALCNAIIVVGHAATVTLNKVTFEYLYTENSTP